VSGPSSGAGLSPLAGAVLRAATRRSPLARWQAAHVAGLLATAFPGLTVELVGIETEGDQRLDVPIAEIGGKGVFAKEVQRAVLDGHADFAVHSAKDLPAVTVDGLVLAAVPERADPHDALVGARLHDLPPGAVVATGSQRRRAQLSRLRPDLTFRELRGNMASRLSKVPDGGAIVVAVAAFERLDLAAHLAQVLSVEEMIPQVGQGALAVECRADDAATRALVGAIEHAPSRRRVDAERAFLVELGGDCDLPAGAHARFEGVQQSGVLVLDAFLADSGTAGAAHVRHQASGDDPVALGAAAARHVRSALAERTTGP
jgi:hydroxymethylbilane synthase